MMIATNRAMTEYERGEFEMFRLISSVYFETDVYFLQDNGMVYSRASGKEITFQEAVNEFLGRIRFDG